MTENLGTGNTTIKGLFADTGYMFRISGENWYGVGVPSIPSSKYPIHSDCVVVNN